MEDDQLMEISQDNNGNVFMTNTSVFHPLLSMIDFKNTTVDIAFLINVQHFYIWLKDIIPILNALQIWESLHVMGTDDHVHECFTLSDGRYLEESYSQFYRRLAQSLCEYQFDAYKADCYKLLQFTASFNDKGEMENDDHDFIKTIFHTFDFDDIKPCITIVSRENSRQTFLDSQLQNVIFLDEEGDQEVTAENLKDAVQFKVYANSSGISAVDFLLPYLHLKYPNFQRIEGRYDVGFYRLNNHSASQLAFLSYLKDPS